MTDKQKLIPGIREWQKLNGESFDIGDWIAIEGNIKLAIGYTFIFWPEFIEHDNCVFLRSHFSLENYNEWRNVDYVESFAQIEYVINHIHILDFFANEKQQSEITKEQVIYLGNVLRDMYETKLKVQFKDKEFIVVFNGDEDFNDVYDYEMSFHQKSSELRKTRNNS